MNDNVKQTTIYDISQKAGVSIATVSRVLNDSPKVSEKTKAKVLKIMEEMDYEPNVFARSLGTGSMKTIGIMCDDVNDMYMANAVSCLERELKQNGFDTMLHCTGYDYDNKRKSMKMMESRKVDAVIMVGSQYVEKISRKNEYVLETARNIPVMMVNGYIKGDNIYCTLCDDADAFYEATEMLRNTGCRKILFLYREMSYSRDRKFDGYCRALADYEIELDENLILQSNKKMQMVKEDLIDFYEEYGDFDAILACDDELAIGAIKFAQEMNISIPEQMSIVGCNNSVLAICTSPEITSIDNECEMMCVNTVNLLMRALDDLAAPHKTVISCKLVERQTTKKVEI